MLRNIQPLTRMVLSGFAMVLLASGCENPAADNRGGGGGVLDRLPWPSLTRYG